MIGSRLIYILTAATKAVTSMLAVRHVWEGLPKPMMLTHLRCGPRAATVPRTICCSEDRCDKAAHGSCMTSSEKPEASDVGLIHILCMFSQAFAARQRISVTWNRPSRQQPSDLGMTCVSTYVVQNRRPEARASCIVIGVPGIVMETYQWPPEACVQLYEARELAGC
ncbi:hypothetical protein BC834DRAFT_907664, partial [Gloeopeniophorella convolvens]